MLKPHTGPESRPKGHSFGIHWMHGALLANVLGTYLVHILSEF